MCTFAQTSRPATKQAEVDAIIYARCRVETRVWFFWVMFFWSSLGCVFVKRHLFSVKHLTIASYGEKHPPAWSRSGFDRRELACFTRMLHIHRCTNWPQLQSEWPTFIKHNFISKIVGYALYETHHYTRSVPIAPNRYQIKVVVHKCERSIFLELRRAEIMASGKAKRHV